MRILLVSRSPAPGQTMAPGSALSARRKPAVLSGMVLT